MKRRKNVPTNTEQDKKAAGSSFAMASPMAAKLPAPSPGMSLTVYLC